MQMGESLSKSYNALLPIADASRALHDRNGEQVVGELLSVIAEAGLEDYVGIRLLHKHNDIADDEIMAEESEIDDEGFALVTSAHNQQILENFTCNSWQLSEQGCTPIEFSDAKLIQSGFDPADHVKLFEKLSDILRRRKMTDLLGPSLNYSSYIDQFSPSENAAFLEKTDFDNRANVVRFVCRDDIAFTNSTKTKWYAKKIMDDKGNLTWMMACNCFCSVFPSGGHQGTKTHSYNP